MDAWDVLGIIPTSDEKAIKRAYAQKLRSCRPDDDADGFQRLKQAFDSAKQQAKSPHTNTTCKPETSFSQAELRVLTEHLSQATYHPAPAQTTRARPSARPGEDGFGAPFSHNFAHRTCRALILEVEKIPPQLPDKLLEQAWLRILNDEKLWRIETKQLLSFYLFRYITDHLTQKPVVWRLLRDHFNWPLQQFQLAQEFSEDTIVQVLDCLTQPPHSATDTTAQPVATAQTTPSKPRTEGKKWAYFSSAIGFVLLLFVFPLMQADWSNPRNGRPQDLFQPTERTFTLPDQAFTNTDATSPANATDTSAAFYAAPFEPPKGNPLQPPTPLSSAAHSIQGHPQL